MESYSAGTWAVRTGAGEPENGIAHDQNPQCEQAVSAVGDNRAAEKRQRSQQHEYGCPGKANRPIGTRALRFAYAKPNQTDERRRVVGDEEEGRDRNDRLEGAASEEGDGDQPSRHDRHEWRTSPVEARRHRNPQPVTAHRVQHARPHQDIRVHGARQRHNDQQSNDAFAAWAEDRVRHGAGGQLRSGERGQRHCVEKCEVEKEIDGGHSGETVEHGARDLSPRVVQFLGEVQRPVPPIVRIDHRLGGEKECSEARYGYRAGRSRGRRAHGFGDGIVVAEGEARDDQREERDRFDEARYPLNAVAAFGAAQQ